MMMRVFAALFIFLFASLSADAAIAPSFQYKDAGWNFCGPVPGGSSCTPPSTSPGLSTSDMKTLADSVAASWSGHTYVSAGGDWSIGVGLAQRSYSYTSGSGLMISRVNGCPSGYVVNGDASPNSGLQVGFCKSTSVACPSNSTLTNGTCVCNSGYNEVSGACQQVVNCTAGTIKSGYIDVLGQSASVCSAVDGCVYSGSAPSGSPIAYYAGTLSNPVAQYGVSWRNTGKSCASQQMTGVGISLIDVTGQPGGISCPAGQIVKMANGTAGCAAADTSSSSSGSKADSPAASTTPGSSPDNPLNIDKSGLATDATLNKNADTAHADAQAIKASIDALNTGANKKAVIDETGTPNDSSLAGAHQNFDTAAQGLVDQTNSIGGSRKVTTLDWVWSPSIPTGQCETFDFSGRWATVPAIDVCQGGHVDVLRSILAWVYAFMVAIYVWHRTSGAVGGGK